jgi:hypothetical protein
MVTPAFSELVFVLLAATLEFALVFAFTFAFEFVLAAGWHDANEIKIRESRQPIIRFGLLILNIESLKSSFLLKPPAENELEGGCDSGRIARRPDTAKHHGFTELLKI